MDREGITQIGEIINSHGIKGELKVVPTTGDPEMFLELDRLILLENDRRSEVSIVNARPAKNCWLIRLAEIGDMSSAKKLKGCGLYVEDEKLRPLDEDEVFIHDLMDAKVYSTDNQYLGIITHYFEAGPQGVCEVTLDGESFLFPATREVLREVAPPDKVVIHLLPELRDLNIKRK
ncbi:MAG: 16S rRNA processing protein RimM [Proteobacteria bacterium]|nr:16S rRNA processing protein RimM [Pseudomonadota bacterium]